MLSREYRAHRTRGLVPLNKSHPFSYSESPNHFGAEALLEVAKRLIRLKTTEIKADILYGVGNRCLFSQDLVCFINITCGPIPFRCSAVSPNNLFLVIGHG